MVLTIPVIIGLIVGAIGNLFLAEHGTRFRHGLRCGCFDKTAAVDWLDSEASGSRGEPYRPKES